MPETRLGGGGAEEYNQEKEVGQGEDKEGGLNGERKKGRTKAE